jgi:hypothetical protein
MTGLQQGRSISRPLPLATSLLASLQRVLIKRAVTFQVLMWIGENASTPPTRPVPWELFSMFARQPGSTEGTPLKRQRATPIQMWPIAVCALAGCRYCGNTSMKPTRPGMLPLKKIRFGLVGSMSMRRGSDSASGSANSIHSLVLGSKRAIMSTWCWLTQI